MTFVGKIFTVLIFLASIIFGALAVVTVGTHKNWKEEVIAQPDGLRATVKRLKANIADMEARRLALQEEIERERVRRANVIADLNSKNKGLNDRVDAAERQKDTKETQRAAAVAASNAANTALVKANADNDRLREAISRAQQERDAEFARVVEITDKLHAAQGTLTILEERRGQLAGQLSQFKAVMDAHGLTEHSDIANIEPKVDGYITAVSTKNADLVEISLGADDGLRSGHQLDVHRGGVYLGRIVVSQTSPNRSIGRIVKELRRGQIKKNDRVTTKFG